MSLLLDVAASSSSSSSPRDCAKRALSHHLRSRFSKKLLLLLTTPLFSLLFLLFLLWLILRPSAPEFSLRDAALLPPPPSPPSTDPLPAAAAVTVTAVVAARNPNAHVGAFYDRLRMRASCGREPSAAAAAEAAVPGFYQEPRSITTVSAVMSSTALRGVAQRPAALLMEIALEGRVRWKVGMWVSRGYGFEVACLAVVEVVGAAASNTNTVQLSSLRGAQCSTDI